MESVWSSVLDGKYDCEVTRTGPYTGILTVVDTKKDEKILSEEVSLAYGAQFGPDIEDVSTWQTMCLKAIGE